MVEFLPIIIPEDLQTEAIENFDDYHYARKGQSEMPAYKFLYDALCEQSGGNKIVRLHINTTLARGGINDKNTDIHLDPPSGNKYLTTVASIGAAATIFFNVGKLKEKAQQGESLLVTNWVRRSADGLIVPIEKDFAWSYAQAPNGQLVRFSMREDQHAAAPLPEGTKKILFTAIV